MLFLAAGIGRRRLLPAALIRGVGFGLVCSTRSVALSVNLTSISRWIFFFFCLSLDLGTRLPSGSSVCGLCFAKVLTSKHESLCVFAPFVCPLRCHEFGRRLQCLSPFSSRHEVQTSEFASLYLFVTVHAFSMLRFVFGLGWISPSYLLLGVVKTHLMLLSVQVHRFYLLSYFFEPLFFNPYFV